MKTHICELCRHCEIKTVEIRGKKNLSMFCKITYRNVLKWHFKCQNFRPRSGLLPGKMEQKTIG